jgi:ATP-dependent Lhr-like helicase
MAGEGRTARSVLQSPEVQRWFEANFEGPTPVQAQAWPKIAAGGDVLAIAPTGSGKTLAGFLVSIDRLVSETGRPGSGTRILYVSPLKALAADVERNLQAPLRGIQLAGLALGRPPAEITVASRTGDTLAKERRWMARHPPDILITTPESLYLLLTSKAAEILRGVEMVLIDEIHSLAPTKRGAHLALSLERMSRLIEAAGHRRPQRVGLSATANPPSELARFLAGQDDDGRPRPVEIVHCGASKEMDLAVTVPVSDMADLGRNCDRMSGPAHDHPARLVSIWPHIHEKLLELIDSHRCTIVFVNSRRSAERLASRLNELAGRELCRAHHGSMSKARRQEVEDGLKAGALAGIVATSSLELGIDMALVDLVVMVEAPPSVASGLQRAGRSGHRVDGRSRAVLMPKHRNDLLLCAASAGMMRAGRLEAIRVPRLPLDVLAQQTVAEALARFPEEVPREELLALARRSYPFAELSYEALDRLLEMLSGNLPASVIVNAQPRLDVNPATGAIRARPGARVIAVSNAGTISDRGLYRVVNSHRERVGDLDEEMVAESRVGEVFLLGATAWRITSIGRDEVVVEPAPGVPAKMPFWHGEQSGRSKELAEAVGRILDRADAVLSGRAFAPSPEAWAQELSEQLALTPLATSNLVDLMTDEYHHCQGFLVTGRRIVVQRFTDELGDVRLAVLTPFGSRVHVPWAMVISARIEALYPGYEAIHVMPSDDGILVRLPESFVGNPLDLVALDPDDLEEPILAQLSTSTLFASRFRDAAVRSLLLPRRLPNRRTPLWLMRQRSADLLADVQHDGGFPILVEAYRECLGEVLAISDLVELGRRINALDIEVRLVEVESPSPMATSLVLTYVSNYLYEKDLPPGERRAAALSIDRRLLGQLLGSEDMRQLLDPLAIEELGAELQMLPPTPPAATFEAAVDLLARLGDLSDEELAARTDAESIGPGLAERLLDSGMAVQIRIGGQPRWIRNFDLHRYQSAFGVATPAAAASTARPTSSDHLDPEAAFDFILERYAATHGPFGIPEFAARYHVAESLVNEGVGRLTRAGKVVLGTFLPTGRTEEVCHSGVLARLKRISLARARRLVEPVDRAVLDLFYPRWQRVNGYRPRSGSPGGRGCDQALLLECVKRIEGYPVALSALEGQILPARVPNSTPSALDELLSGGEVVFLALGATAGARDLRLVLLTRDRAADWLAFLRLERTPVGQGWPAHVVAELERRGSSFLAPLIASGAGLAGDPLSAVRSLLAGGWISNDSLAPVRALMQGSGRAAMAAASRGRWYLVSREFGSARPDAAISIVEGLVGRYGVLTPANLKAEAIEGGMARLFPVAAAMAESGRLQRGYFIDGLGGVQFAASAAVELLRDLSRTPTPGIDGIVAATDPACPYGTATPWPAPRCSRASGAVILYCGGRASVYIDKGANRAVALRPESQPGEQPFEPMASDLLAEYLTVARRSITEVDATLSPWLTRAGFVPTPKGLRPPPTGLLGRPEVPPRDRGPRPDVYQVAHRAPFGSGSG